MAAAGHREATSRTADGRTLTRFKGTGALAASCALIVAADRLLADTPARSAATR